MHSRLNVLIDKKKLIAWILSLDNIAHRPKMFETLDFISG